MVKKKTSKCPTQKHSKNTQKTLKKAQKKFKKTPKNTQKTHFPPVFSPRLSGIKQSPRALFYSAFAARLVFFI
jgi:Flp pilus assembly protein TadB